MPQPKRLAATRQGSALTGKEKPKKSQISNLKQIPMINDQMGSDNLRKFEFCYLEFVCNLQFDIWNFERTPKKFIVSSLVVQRREGIPRPIIGAATVI